MSLLIWMPFTTDVLRNNGIGLQNIAPVGTPSLSSDGKLGGCLNRISDATGIEINSNLVSELGSEYTMAVWAKPLGNHTHYNGTFISSGNWNVSTWAFGVNQNNTQVDVAGPGFNKYIDCTVPVNQWTHLCCTVKSGVSKLYKNGEYIGSYSLGNGGKLHSDATWTCIQRETYAGGYFSFNGKLNDLRIYNHALSVTEIKDISKGLIAHYPLKGLYSEAGNIEEDVSGNNYPGTSFGNFTVESGSARYNNCIAFNGINNYINIGKNAKRPDFITANLWINKKNTGTPLSCADSGGWDIYYTSGKLSIEMYITGRGYLYAFDDIPYSNWTAGWHMVSFTFNGMDLKFYRDGICRGTNHISNTPISIQYNSGNNIVIGADAAGEYASSPWFQGQISDVRIYATALTDNDIKKLYESPTKISKEGDLITNGEFVEVNTNPKVLKNGNVNALNFLENSTKTIFKKNKEIRTNYIIEN